ncbi:alpha/beta hydrolase [Salinicola socius]|uniref:BD-FAE-like domain-containing protein n=1 Tax=Salinicola socius TaxID=404433 RepID=A0A1Q8SPL7_9GAMM|nr:alpha/beta hydrolase [Salinicola socius]OLO03380.1 hypothetical protein BTW07_14985 [Salinicola socius]
MPTRVMKSLGRLLPALLVCALISGCTTYINAPDRDVPETARQPHDLDYRVVEDQTYTPPDWPKPLQADVYLPDTEGEARRPAVMMVHGGGWEGRSRDDMTPIAERFVRRGYVVVNVSYRFAPAYRFPAQLRDLQVARRWINAHADQWRVDPQRIAGFGYSSGAHLVSLLALVAGTDSELDAPYGGSDSGFAAVVSGGTPADLRLWDSGRLLIQLMNGTEAERPTAYAEASPIFHVHPDAPPFFLFHGSWDDLVPPEQAEAFLQALENEGNHVELLWMNGRGHITTFLFRGSAESAALDFLAREMPASNSSP